MGDGPFWLQRKSLALSSLIQGGMDVSSSFINIYVHPESTIHILHLTEIITVMVLLGANLTWGFLSMANMAPLSCAEFGAKAL